jgi:predicted molibdopterin-dependent oxidoreductase YjgC
VRKALDPPGEAKADWEIWSELASNMGYDMKYQHPVDIIQEISNTVPNYNGIHYTLLTESENGVLWPIDPKTHAGSRLLYQDEFPTGKAHFRPVKISHIPTAKKYPYNLMAGKILFQFHTGSVSRKSFALLQLVDEPFVGIHPEDAQKIKVNEGNQVRICTQNGEILIKAKFMSSLPLGTIFVPIHFDRVLNELFSLPTDHHAPAIKGCPAQLQAA